MPTYEYECQGCGHRLEIFHSMSAKPEKNCPNCRKPKLRRLISAGGALLFRGSGFYITDYRNDDYKKKAKSESAPEPAAPTSPAPASADGGAKAPVPPTPAEPSKKDPASGAKSKPKKKS